MRILCLGEALVDLVCERPVDSLLQADAFVPHFGGATANAAVAAARNGGRVALAGGAGDDAWGAWLRDRLEAEGVGTEWFELREGAATTVAFVTVDGRGEPSYALYGEVSQHLAADRAEAALAACDALLLSSNLLADPGDEEVALGAREQALAAGKPVVFDANLRIHRWDNAAAAAGAARACLPGAFLVKCNAEEARLLSGEDDPQAAAAGLLAAGAKHVVITLGPDGALLRGEGRLRRDVPGVPAELVNAAGAGDAFLGVLLGRLSGTDFYPAALAAALPDAVAAGARATERWGAIG